MINKEEILKLKTITKFLESNPFITTSDYLKVL